MSGDPLYDHLENMKQPRVFRDAYHELDEIRHERDTLITALRECVVALGGLVSGFTVNDLHDIELMQKGRAAGEMSCGDVLAAEKAWTHAKATLERYNHEHP